MNLPAPHALHPAQSVFAVAVHSVLMYVKSPQILHGLQELR